MRGSAPPSERRCGQCGETPLDGWGRLKRGVNGTQRRKAPTLVDVARQAGVARATAARVLGDYGSVRPDLRARVLEAAAALRYRPNRLARSMASGASRTLGAVIAGNPYFAIAVRGISDEARAAGFEVVLVNSDEDLAEERAAVQVLVEKQVDGLIVAPAPDGATEHLLRIRDTGTALVLLDRNLPQLGCDAVIIDGMRAGAAATASLIALGHERIAIVTDVPTARAVADPAVAALEVGQRGTAAMRLVGFLTALREAGLPLHPDLVRQAAPTVEGARETTLSLLDAAVRPTAIFTTDNVMTLGAFEAVQERGIAIPQEVSLLGFDDLEWTRIVRPPLTVVAQPVYEMGVTAARLLLARIAGDERPAQTVVLPTQLVQRESVAAPPDVAR
jgi:LacI family transcriptional regulator